MKNSQAKPKEESGDTRVDTAAFRKNGHFRATRAAAASGYTMLVDMPLNCIPSTTTVDALEAKRKAAASKCRVDWAAWGGVVSGNQADIEPLAAAGVLGFKCFLIHPGTAEFSMVTELELRKALPHIVRTGLPLLVHAELAGPVDAAHSQLAAGDWKSYATYLKSRPDEAELSAIRMLVSLVASSDSVSTSYISQPPKDCLSCVPHAMRDCPSPLRLAHTICISPRRRSRKAPHNASAPRPFAAARIAKGFGRAFAMARSIWWQPTIRPVLLC